MMTSEAQGQLEEMITKTIELPVLPVTAQKVLSMMSDPDASIEKIKRIISTDPGLATKLMTVANSAFYGSYRNIQNLSQAILRLGLNSVRNIVVATSMKNVYKRFGLAEKLLWEQLIGSAMAASLLARSTRLADPEDAFIGGLLHDVGKIVLNNEFPEDFARVMEQVYNEHKSFEEAEKQVFEFTHREVGAIVVRKWGFPESLENLIRRFDDAEFLGADREMYNLVSLIKVADRMCQKFGMGWRNPAGDSVTYGNIPDALELSPELVKETEEKVKLTFSQATSLY